MSVSLCYFKGLDIENKFVNNITERYYHYYITYKHYDYISHSYSTKVDVIDLFNEYCDVYFPEFEDFDDGYMEIKYLELIEPNDMVKCCDIILENKSEINKNIEDDNYYNYLIEIIKQIKQLSKEGYYFKYDCF